MKKIKEMKKKERPSKLGATKKKNSPPKGPPIHFSSL